MDAAWEDVPQLIVDWTPRASQVSPRVKLAVSTCFSHGDLGFYTHPGLDENIVGVYARVPTDTDLDASEYLLKGAGFCHRHLAFDDICCEPWIKVAAAPSLPALRRVGIPLNFFPGEYAHGVPNQPSPLAATLTGGAAGAGLGYGAGWLAERLLPDNWRRNRLRRGLALLGGTLGAAPGMAYMYAAGREGKSPLDNTILNASSASLQMNPTEKASIDAFVKLAFSTFGEQQPGPPRDLTTVDVNQLGQVLWRSGISPQMTSTTLSTMYAAQQLPDPNARPGNVTPNQVGLLGTMMGAAGGGLAGYVTGYGVGKALGVLTGLPPSAQNTMANTGLALGVVNSMVPRLFR